MQIAILARSPAAIDQFNAVSMNEGNEEHLDS